MNALAEGRPPGPADDARDGETSTINLKCYRVTEHIAPIVPGRSKRAWMDATNQHYAYRCIPLTMANATGWELVMPFTFAAYWNGGPEKSDMRFEALDGYRHLRAMVRSDFGHGIVTFYPGYLFTTDPGWTLWARGAPNWPKDGIAPLEGLIETDWLPFSFTMNWLFTRPGKVIFEKGEPFCFVTPMPYHLIEQIVPEVQSIDSNPALRNEFKAWSKSRGEFIAKLDRRDPEVVRAGWQRYYVHGRTALGTSASTSHQNKRRVHDAVHLLDPPKGPKPIDRPNLENLPASQSLPTVSSGAQDRSATNPLLLRTPAMNCMIAGSLQMSLDQLHSDILTINHGDSRASHGTSG